MTKIDIFSGFLGAGKTTLIKKLLKEALAGSQVVLIENEFRMHLLFTGRRFWDIPEGGYGYVSSGTDPD